MVRFTALMSGSKEPIVNSEPKTCSISPHGFGLCCLANSSRVMEIWSRDVYGLQGSKFKEQDVVCGEK